MTYFQSWPMNLNKNKDQAKRIPRAITKYDPSLTLEQLKCGHCGNIGHRQNFSTPSCPGRANSTHSTFFLLLIFHRQLSSSKYHVAFPYFYVPEDSMLKLEADASSYSFARRVPTISISSFIHNAFNAS